MASPSASASTSPSNPNPWAPYDSYKDCSQGICSIYCPQWCYIIFPPPPPFTLEDDSGTDFSPLIIAVIGILASAFILVSYYTIISKYCRRRSRDHDGFTDGGVEIHDNHSVNNNNDGWQSGGLDEALIKSIAVCRYKKGEGLVEGADCSVCLSEFLEGESLRLLPKCNHAFHLPCIDTWLKSHSNCPLCRANIASSATNIVQPHQTPPDHHHHPPVQETMTRAETVTLSVNQYQHRNETVLVIHELESGVGEQTAVNLVVNDDDDDVVLRQNTSDQVGVGVQAIRRSVSLNSSSSVCRGPVLVADILRSNEEEEEDRDYRMENTDQKNTSNRALNLVKNSPLALKRSVSTGRFMFTRYGKAGNDSVISN